MIFQNELVFFCLPHISLGQYCQKNVGTGSGRGFRKNAYSEDYHIRGVVHRRGGSNLHTMAVERPNYRGFNLPEEVLELITRIIVLVIK